MGYAEILKFVTAGHIAAFAPAYTEDGRPAVCFVVDNTPLPTSTQLILHRATREQHAKIAVRAIAQVRRAYGIS